MSKKSLPRWQRLARRYNIHLWRKHPFFFPVVGLLLTFFIAVVSFILLNGKPAFSSDSYIVVLSHDKKRETIPTRAQTVGELLERSGVQLNEGDVVEPSADTEIREDNFRVNVYRARPVLIVDGEAKTFAFSAATTPRSVAAQAQVRVYPEDRIVSEMQTSFLSDGAIGERVVIDRATPAQLNLYGTPIAVRTHAKTVGDLLAEKQVNVAPGDQIQPSPTTVLTPQTQVFVLRNGTKIETKEEPIAMETETIQDASLSFGTTVVRQQGSPGKRVVTYQIDLVNDKEVGRKVIQTVVAQEPVKQIVARGKAVNIPSDKEAVMAAAGISSGDYAYVNYIISRESGWNAAARNARSGATGLCQALPGTKMASAGADWETNPVTQLRWCNGYAVGRYGSWGAAYDFWLKNHWW